MTRQPDPRPHVIVIGVGAAGLAAAVALAQADVRVTALGKTSPGSATCTLYAGGGFTLGIGGVSPEKHREMTAETGRHLNVPELLSTFATEAPTIVDFLNQAGIRFVVGRGVLSVRADEGHTLLGGKGLTDGLKQKALELGVTFVGNLVALRLLQGERGVNGVECVDYASGEAVRLEADAVVLATGGGGAIYDRTDNPQRITGDGYRLALDAGCHLLDMEFVQFYPIGFDIPGGSRWFIDLGIIDQARLTNCDGVEFLKEMLAREGIDSGRKANLLARDKCAVAIAREAARGDVLLHLEDIPEAEWADGYLNGIARLFPKAAPAWTQPVRVRPIEHYFPGGVAIGIHGETELPGLYACGEVTGGVDGANRVGGNALTNCILFATRAAATAAAHARGAEVPALVLTGAVAPTNGDSVTLDLPLARPVGDWLSAWRAGTIAPAAWRDDLHALTAACLTPLRDAARLTAGRDRLIALGAQLSQQKATEGRDLLLAAENLGLWQTTAAVLTGALLRHESRGAHSRDDFPREDPAWERHIYFARLGDRLAAELSERA